MDHKLIKKNEMISVVSVLGYEIDVDNFLS